MNKKNLHLRSIFSILHSPIRHVAPQDKQFSTFRGFTLIELIIVIAIIGVLTSAIIYTLNPKGQIDRTLDAERKSDLALIQRALEEYYNDHGTYPGSNNGKMIDGDTGAIISWDGKSTWGKYMKLLPQDPNYPNKQYYYQFANGYVIYASLDIKTDPKVCNKGREDQNCTSVSTYIGPGSDFCGSGKVCNYGVSSPNLAP